MELTQFIQSLTNEPQHIEFEQTMAVIEANYQFIPTAFSNGDVHNEAGQNNGSCKIFAFAELNQLSPEQTLACFGRYYREDVLAHPDNDDHQNIRNFMTRGWGGVKFESVALVAKKKG